MLVCLGDKFLGVSLHSAKTLKKKQRGVKGVVFNVQPSQSCALRTSVGFRVNERVHFGGVCVWGGEDSCLLVSLSKNDTNVWEDKHLFLCKSEENEKCH